ncbi:histidine kinase [Halorientalis salina]|uniref:histidine kinase n=1 Tax=Halorientalis salina TaxID=2932266 RepID=UPI0010AD1DE0|nr:histidine kinase [Halorientalis salina]
MSLERFFTELDAPSRTLLVVNRDAPRQLQTILEETFQDQSVDVTDAMLPDTDADTVVLVDDDSGEIVASSPLSQLERTILLVNSDLYKTGTETLDTFELPDVLAGLDEIPFRLQGYPESNNEKLLLIVISRYIERLAWQTDAGRHRASFQHLSRLNDESGTRSVYETLGPSDVQTHVYGVPDWIPSEDMGLITHGGYTDEFTDAWFVVHSPPEAHADQAAALVALETDARLWDGFWTFDPDWVDEIDRYIAHNL